MVVEEHPSLYFYRLRMGSHEQTGLAGCFALDEYDRGLIRKHERTRADKEDDRTRHMLALGAQTGIVFLTYRATTDISSVTTRGLSAGSLVRLHGSRRGPTHGLASQTCRRGLGRDRVRPSLPVSLHRRRPSSNRQRGTRARRALVRQQSRRLGPKRASFSGWRSPTVRPEHSSVQSDGDQSRRAHPGRFRRCGAGQVSRYGPMSTRCLKKGRSRCISMATGTGSTSGAGRRYACHVTSRPSSTSQCCRITFWRRCCTWPMSEPMRG